MQINGGRRVRIQIRFFLSILFRNLGLVHKTTSLSHHFPAVAPVNKKSRGSKDKQADYYQSNVAVVLRSTLQIKTIAFSDSTPDSIFPGTTFILNVNSCLEALERYEHTLEKIVF